MRPRPPAQSPIKQANNIVRIFYNILSYDAFVNVHLESITNHHTNPFLKR